jgi:hypothetical protein
VGLDLAAAYQEMGNRLGLVPAADSVAMSDLAAELLARLHGSFQDYRLLPQTERWIRRSAISALAAPELKRTDP